MSYRNWIALYFFFLNEKITLTTAVTCKSQKQKTMYSRKGKTTYDQGKHSINYKLQATEQLLKTCDNSSLYHQFGFGG